MRRCDIWAGAGRGVQFARRPQGACNKTGWGAASVLTPDHCGCTARSRLPPNRRRLRHGESGVLAEFWWDALGRISTSSTAPSFVGVFDEVGPNSAATGVSDLNPADVDSGMTGSRGLAYVTDSLGRSLDCPAIFALSSRPSVCVPANEGFAARSDFFCTASLMPVPAGPDETDLPCALRLHLF